MDQHNNREEAVGAILLAGGQGSRMLSATPKQFLPLKGRPIALHSFELLLSCSKIKEIVVVCSDFYRSEFEQTFPKQHKPVTFAAPGKERQDSVYNGFLKLSKEITFACIHDSARPFLDLKALENVIEAALCHGAAALGVPVKNTIKERDVNSFVVRTPARETLWEMQTPQVLSIDILRKGLQHCYENKQLVTDDISLAEIQGLSAKLVMGNYNNIKITTIEDLILAEQLVQSVLNS